MTRRTALRIMIGISTAMTLAACGSSPGMESDVLPGRSRPLLQHDWPHPSKYDFPDNSFNPPKPSDALFTTAAGLRAFILDDPTALTVRLTLALPLGRIFEAEGETGAADLLTYLLVRGMSESGRSLADEVESRGAQIGIDQEADLTVITIEMLPDDWKPLLNQAIASLRAPTIDPAVVRGWRAGTGYASITAGVAGSGFRPKVELERLFGAWPFSPAPEGTQVSVAAVSALADRTLRPQAVILGVGGAVSSDEVRAFIRDATSRWSPRGAEMPMTRPLAADRTPKQSLFLIDEPAYTGWVAIGHPQLEVPEADLAAFAVLVEVANIRLNVTVREVRGLANKTSLEVSPHPRRGGLLHVRTGGRPEAVAPLMHYIRKELTHLRDVSTEIHEAELEDIRGGIVLSQWQRRLDGSRAASTTYAVETVRRGNLEFLLAWPDAVRAVRADAVKAAARSYLHPDRLVAVVLGPVEKIRRARHPRWPFSLDEFGRNSESGSYEDERDQLAQLSRRWEGKVFTKPD